MKERSNQDRQRKDQKGREANPARPQKQGQKGDPAQSPERRRGGMNEPTRRTPPDELE